MDILTTLQRHIGSIIFATICTLSTLNASAFTPSQAQIDQFMSLPEAQQRQIAARMGVDLDDIMSAAGDIKGAGKKGTGPRSTISGPRTPPQVISPSGELTEVEAENVPSVVSAAVAKGEDGSDEAIVLKAFGYDLFSLGADAFVPTEDVPIPADYILGPGDTLVIQLYGKQSDSHTLTINRDGSVQFPNIGPVTLAGLKFSSVVAKIEEVVSEQMIGIKSSVTMGELRTIRVFVLGDAIVPGSYVVGSLSTMTNALFASGGIDSIGSLRNVQLKRAGKLITTLDLYDLLLRGDTSNDARLLPGDVIFIPPVGKMAAVSGAVKRPALYELKNEQTAQDLLKLAGGLRATAYLPASKIERVSESGERTLVKVNLKGSNAKRFRIQDADILHVGDSLTSLTDTIAIEGHVKRATRFAWSRNARLTDYITNSNMLRALPDLNIALIEREIPNSREIEVISFSPKAAFAAPGTKADPQLHARDKITFFGYENDRSELLEELLNKVQLQASFEQHTKTVRIDGSVRFPGTYPLSKDMSANELILLAGGYTESALGRDAEITRYEVNAAMERVVLHIDVNLKNEAPKLYAGDTLRVQQIPLWTTKETVTLEGEFLHPGQYALLPGESLLDVVKRAGGLTARAYPDGAIFSRSELRDLETKQLESFKADLQKDLAAARLESSKTKQELDEEQAQRIIENLERIKILGRLVIDFPAIIANPDTMDFQLIDGDTINMPHYKPSVTVVGEVQYPTSHFYSGKLSVKDYLHRSGGLNRDADKKRIYVVKANGNVIKPKMSGWFGGHNDILSPGDTIVVPLDTRRNDNLSVWSSVTTIMYQAAIGLSAIKSFSN